MKDTPTPKSIIHSLYSFSPFRKDFHNRWIDLGMQSMLSLAKTLSSQVGGEPILVNKSEINKRFKLVELTYEKDIKRASEDFANYPEVKSTLETSKKYFDEIFKPAVQKEMDGKFFITRTSLDKIYLESIKGAVDNLTEGGKNNSEKYNEKVIENFEKVISQVCNGRESILISK